VAIHIQPLQGWLEPLVLPQVSPVAIHIQPLQGWLGPLVLAIHIQPLRGWRVGYTFSPGSTWGYSHSTPTGLAWI